MNIRKGEKTRRVEIKRIFNFQAAAESHSGSAGVASRHARGMANRARR